MAFTQPRVLHMSEPATPLDEDRLRFLAHRMLLRYRHEGSVQPAALANVASVTAALEEEEEEALAQARSAGAARPKRSTATATTHVGGAAGGAGAGGQQHQQREQTADELALLEFGPPEDFDSMISRVIAGQGRAEQMRRHAAQARTEGQPSPSARGGRRGEAGASMPAHDMEEATKLVALYTSTAIDDFRSVAGLGGEGSGVAETAHRHDDAATRRALAFAESAPLGLAESLRAARRGARGSAALLGGGADTTVAAAAAASRRFAVALKNTVRSWRRVESYIATGFAELQAAAHRTIATLVAGPASALSPELLLVGTGVSTRSASMLRGPTAALLAQERQALVSRVRAVLHPPALRDRLRTLEWAEERRRSAYRCVLASCDRCGVCLLLKPESHLYSLP